MCQLFPCARDLAPCLALRKLWGGTEKGEEASDGQSEALWVVRGQPEDSRNQRPVEFDLARLCRSIIKGEVASAAVGGGEAWALNHSLWA